MKGFLRAVNTQQLETRYEVCWFALLSHYLGLLEEKPAYWRVLFYIRLHAIREPGPHSVTSTRSLNFFTTPHFHVTINTFTILDEYVNEETWVAIWCRVIVNVGRLLTKSTRLWWSWSVRRRCWVWLRVHLQARTTATSLVAWFAPAISFGVHFHTGFIFRALMKGYVREVANLFS